MKNPVQVKKRSLWFTLGILLLVFILLGFPRSVVIGWLKVPDTPPDCVDLSVIFGGGFLDDGSPGHSSQERLETFLSWWKMHGCGGAVLISEYPGGRNRLETVLTDEGFPSADLLHSGYHYEENEGGTIQNVEELVHVIREHGEIRTVAVFTSPYHQFRVRMMIRDKLGDRIENGQITVYFFPVPDDGEIMTCSRFRFLRLVTREFAGIVIQAIRQLG